MTGYYRKKSRPAAKRVRLNKDGSVRKPDRRLEQEGQIAIFNFLRPLMLLQKGKHFLALHIPNGGFRTGFEAKILKAMGTFAGVADILLLLPAKYAPCKPRGFETGIEMLEPPRAVFIELKAGDGGQEDSQEGFQRLAEGLGFAYHVITFKDVWDAVRQMQDLMEGYGVPINGVPRIK